MRISRNSSVYAALVGGLVFAGISNAATIKFTPAAGSTDLGLASNWTAISGTFTSPMVGNPGHAWVIDDSSSPVTAGTWTTVPSGTYLYWAGITFSKAGDFSIPSIAGKTLYMNGPVSITTPYTFGLPGLTVASGTTYTIGLAPGSTFNHGAIGVGGKLAISNNGLGGGSGQPVMRYATSGARNFELNLGQNVTFASNGTGTTTIDRLTGDGMFRHEQGIVIAKATTATSGFGVSGTTPNSYSGLVHVAAPASPGHYFAFEYNHGSVPAAGTTYTVQGGRFLVNSNALMKSHADGIFQKSEFNGAKYSFGAGSAWDVYGTPVKLKSQGSVLRPGGAASSTGVVTQGAGIMSFWGNLEFGVYDEVSGPDTLSRLEIDIMASGNVAGTDYDQLLIKRSENAAGGGLVTSASDPLGNRLADVNLVVNLADAIKSLDLSSNAYTILSTDTVVAGFSFVGSHFANDVNGKVALNGGGWANVTYGTNSITLSNVVVPEPGVVVLLAASGMLLGLRRKRHS